MVFFALLGEAGFGPTKEWSDYKRKRDGSIAVALAMSAVNGAKRNNPIARSNNKKATFMVAFLLLEQTMGKRNREGSGIVAKRR